ncbi:MAG: hypothetical protein HQL36_05880 [Alphaproteobacteria bacterium]|nr:hypothetical protein [Alphaproteobacteria bacterium]MBF0250569.1 hypothetical protein [Alphaproteobacteria bacterium]
MLLPNRMTIPVIRDRLRELAEEHDIEELRDLANHMYRQNIKGRRAPVTSAPSTPQLRRDIRAYARLHPNASNQEIGNFFGVNPGRVSEALEG